jgi:hypothetical protein
MLSASLPLTPTQIYSAHDYNLAIADSGATSNFLTIDAHVVNIQPTTKPLQVRIPNGNYLQSSHTCQLDIPQLPKAARLGHIIPGMKGHSLISLVQLSNAGCQININRCELKVFYQGKLVLQGQKCNCNRTGLRLIPLKIFMRPTDKTAKPLLLNHHK